MSNVGTTFLITSLVFVLIILVFVILRFVCKLCCKNISIKNKERLKAIKKKIFYNSIIRWAQLGALKMYFSAFVSLKANKDVASIVTIAMLSVAGIIMALTMCYYYADLDLDHIVAKYGAIYDGKRTDENREKRVWLSPLIFFARRLIFATVTLYLFDKPSMQILVQ